jgi:hypothetical protein
MVVFMTGVTILCAPPLLRIVFHGERLATQQVRVAEEEPEQAALPLE